MTASRTCRACGADLTGDVMWCLRCYEPVRQLTPRPPQLPTVRFLEPEPEDERSRWNAGVNTFGPIGRLTVTALVLLFAPWSLNVVTVFVVWPVYLPVAFVVLRATWKKDHVLRETLDEIAVGGRPSERAPVIPRTPIPRSTMVAWAVLALLVLGTGIALALSDHVGRGSIGIAASLAALVLLGRWPVKS